MKFESALNELEKIANTLESGECQLEEAVALYEKAVKLSKECSEILENAKLKITDISKKAEEV